MRPLPSNNLQMRVRCTILHRKILDLQFRVSQKCIRMLNLKVRKKYIPFKINFDSLLEFDYLVVHPAFISRPHAFSIMPRHSNFTIENWKWYTFLGHPTEIQDLVTKILFTRYRFGVLTTSNSVSLRSYLLLPLSMISCC